MPLAVGWKTALGAGDGPGGAELLWLLIMLSRVRGVQVSRALAGGARAVLACPRSHLLCPG